MTTSLRFVTGRLARAAQNFPEFIRGNEHRTDREAESQRRGNNEECEDERTGFHGQKRTHVDTYTGKHESTLRRVTCLLKDLGMQ